jgi:hypothetical protein
VAHPELDQLLNALLPFAERMLMRHGEFHPFACSMKSNGEIVDVGAADGTEHPASSDLISILVDGLTLDARSGKIRASGICLNMRLHESFDRAETDAICCRLEHVSGQAVAVYIPYKMPSKSQVIFQEMFAERLNAEVFKD